MFMVVSVLLGYIAGVLLFLTIYAKLNNELIEVEEVWGYFIFLPLMPILLLIKKIRKIIKNKKSIQK